MHYYHTHIILATDIDAAKTNFEDYFESYRGNIYDYYSLRQSSLPGGDGVTHVTQKNKDLVWTHLQSKINLTNSHFEHLKYGLLDAMKLHKVYDLFSLKHSTKYDMIGYYLSRFGNLINGSLSSETFFFDWDDHHIIITKDKFMKLVEGGDLYALEIDLHN